MKEDQVNITPKTDEEIKQILGINPEENYNKSYLKLKDLIIDDFSWFLPYLDKIRTVDLKNCTLTNFSELLKLNSSYFNFDNVTFKNSDCNIISEFPYEMRFSNMSFDAACLNGLQMSGPKKGFKHLFINNCHIENIQEISNIEGLYSLHLDKITFTCHPKKIKEKSIRMIHIANSQFEDISFIPFKKSVEDIEFINCQIGSITGLSEFKKLEEIEMDTNTTIEKRYELENPFDRKIICHFVQAEKPFSLKNVIAIRNYINQLHFTNFKEKTIEDLGEFEKVNKLSLDDSTFYVDAFLPIAKQIKSVNVSDSVIKKQNYFSDFPNLTCFELSYHGESNIKSRNFSKLLPLKNQLKELDFFEFVEIPAIYPIEQFTALETLEIGSEVSVQTAESIMKLKKLKKLSVSTEKTKTIFDVGNLKKLEFLIFNSRARFTGFEHLKRLKSLEIINDRIFDVKTLPKMKSLKRLRFSAYNCKVKGLSRFPNLEFLKLQGVKELQLKDLKKLKVLDLQNSEIKDFSSFGNLPSLEKLDVSVLQNKINLKGISKFPNLKWLTFSESMELDDISGLEPLKKLERLDLLHTRVTDVRVLSSLPSLKEVNIAVWDADVDLESQLDRPEIAIYCGLPTRNLCIWERDEFGI
ncbi:hypothetical protein [Chryseobacterium sp. BIGb0232]|uniref:hypothetical protein n=1 Tax=Chryseobacterium sp. BIGb0232 TaxID=2940598 RepID=UPI000F469410|nr:hypothetical protein [Chryseobacterium sp. BIGb0232]MCS4300669.1 Leucine-rich repeat (LRR) protein [Chryseobacterium sp. BIGb0232]ROS20448.1 hypothetical protein EDF65_1170 [Chryseobacterium nakagawai]